MTDPYGYDVASNTVRVSRHDLARLLLQFRAMQGAEPPGSWSHMRDYDVSFERLADAVDSGADGPPDNRMRCDRSAVYAWPDHPPYRAVRLRAPRYGSHYAHRERGATDIGAALCGFWFAWSGDGAKVIDGEPSCRECVRENRRLTEMAGGADR